MLLLLNLGLKLVNYQKFYQGKFIRFEGRIRFLREKKNFVNLVNDVLSFK